MNLRRTQRGVSLVELIAALVVLTIALTGLGMALQAVERNRPAGIVERQALAIADAYLDAILSSGSCENEGDPRTLGDIRPCIDGTWRHSGARDHHGRPMTGLEAYVATVTVASIDPRADFSSDLGGLRDIRVSVSHPAVSRSVTIAAWR